MKRILIALPAYNEAKVIGDVIGGIKKEGYRNILVIDDGSNDPTRLVAQKKNVLVVSHFKNSGLGVSLRTAIRFAREHDYDVLVTMDSDGQHVARDIKSFVDKINTGIDITVGVRNFNKSNSPLFRRIILFLSNIYTYILFNIWSHDSQSGFRAFSKHAINVLNLKSERMEISSEIFLEIKKHNLKYAEIPIRAIYTKYSLSKGQKNSNLFNVGLKLLLKIFQ